MSSPLIGDQTMSYRVTTAEDHGFDTEEEVFHAGRAHIQDLMTGFSPHCVMDTLLVTANACQMLALLEQHAGKAEWYAVMATILREVIQSMHTSFALADVHLENTALYFPETPVSH